MVTVNEYFGHFLVSIPHAYFELACAFHPIFVDHVNDYFGHFSVSIPHAHFELACACYLIFDLVFFVFLPPEDCLGALCP